MSRKTPIRPRNFPQPGWPIHIILKDHGAIWLIPDSGYVEFVAGNAIAQQGYQAGGTRKHPDRAYYASRIIPGIVIGYTEDGEYIRDEIETDLRKIRREGNTEPLVESDECYYEFLEGLASIRYTVTRPAVKSIRCLSSARLIAC